MPVAAGPERILPSLIRAGEKRQERTAHSLESALPSKEDGSFHKGARLLTVIIAAIGALIYKRLLVELCGAGADCHYRNTFL